MTAGQEPLVAPDTVMDSHWLDSSLDLQRGLEIVEEPIDLLLPDLRPE